MTSRIISLLILIVSFVAPVSTSAAKSQPAIEMASTYHDFGTIKASGGPVTARYELTNTGSSPLVIINVTNGGCGCTTPEYPKQPVAPGKSATITITFDPTGRRGEFNREVKVKTNAGKRLSLRFSGVVVP
ncbi:MAG: DUF1573 domain-containing protein [Paramuribaculum sp.]|nr:DUF1573 domain-containing protein [Barnesiella sp.]MDE7449689.1 DUF1573 domain-containing protein [Paramuribaculum sp.]